MAVEKTIELRVDGSQAITEIKKIRNEIDSTYSEMRRTTPFSIDPSKAKQSIDKVETDVKKITKEFTKFT